MKRKKDDAPIPRSKSTKATKIVAEPNAMSQGHTLASANNKKKYTFYLDRGLMRDFKKLAVDENTSNSKLVEKVLKAYLGQRAEN
jgi:hypothetical protein